MKAPEEIELNTCTFSDIGLFDIDEEEVTYIRKDALLEWANKKLQESADRLDFHANQAYAEMIDKLNSL